MTENPAQYKEYLLDRKDLSVILSKLIITMHKKLKDQKTDAKTKEKISQFFANQKYFKVAGLKLYYRDLVDLIID